MTDGEPIPHEHPASPDNEPVLNGAGLHALSGMSDLPSPQTYAAISFLKRFHPTTPWALVSLGASGEIGPARTFDPGNPAEIEEARRFIESLQGKYNVYFSVNAVRGKPKKKAKKADINELLYLHVDADLNKQIDWSDPDAVQAEKDRVLEALQAYDPPPTVIAWSGGGYAGFWRLSEIITVNGDKTLMASAERRMQRIAKAFNADDCHNADRLMRLVGTINVLGKTKIAAGRKPALAQLVGFYEDRIYDLQDFPEIERVQKRKATKLNGKAPHQHHSRDTDPERVRDALRHIPSDDREVWRTVGMGIKDELGEAGYPLWLEWAETCKEKFDADDCRYRWDSFNGSGIGIGTVFEFAKRGGWDARHNKHAQPKAAKEEEDSPAQPAPLFEIQGRFMLVRGWIGMGDKKRGPGVYFNEAEEEDEAEHDWKWVCSRLEPLADTRDSESCNWGRQLEVVDSDDVRHIWVMPNVMGPTVADGVEFRRELVYRGLRIASGSKARNRLGDYVTQWKPTRKLRCVSRVGWSGDTFVMHDRAYGGTEDVVMQTEGAAPKFSVGGSLKGWRDDIAANCVGNSRLIFGMSGAFAGPLLMIAGEESGGVHWSGQSSIGKTTMLHVGRSVWGRPLQTWRTTDNSAEAIAAGACDTFLPLDEIGQANPKVVSELAYLLGNGQGKARMKRNATLRESLEWRVFFMSTGEVGMAQRIAEGGGKARAGQEVRVLEIPADAGAGLGVFEKLHGFENGAALAEHLRAAADRNCGHAARAYLENLVKILPNLVSEITKKRAEFIAEYCPPHADGQVRRACGRFAVVAIAGELATLFGITGWEVGDAEEAVARCWRDWLNARGGAGSAELREAVDQVRLYLEQHGEGRFADPWTIQFDKAGNEILPRPVINRAGFRSHHEEQGTTYLILPQVWRKEVCKGFDPTEVAKAMIERGWMLRGDGKNLAMRRKVPGEGSPRLYTITPAFLYGNDEKQSEPSEPSEPANENRHL